MSCNVSRFHIESGNTSKVTVATRVGESRRRGEGGEVDTRVVRHRTGRTRRERNKWRRPDDALSLDLRKNIKKSKKEKKILLSNFRPQHTRKIHFSKSHSPNEKQSKHKTTTKKNTRNLISFVLKYFIGIFFFNFRFASRIFICLFFV